MPNQCGKACFPLKNIKPQHRQQQSPFHRDFTHKIHFKALLCTAPDNIL